jgi:hypothetical protein
VASSNPNVGLNIDVSNGAHAELIVKGEVTFNSNGNGMFLTLDPNSKLDIAVESDASLNMDLNAPGFYANVYSGAELNIDVKGGGSFKSCGNGVYDIGVNDINDPPATAKATFSGDGSYTCDNVYFPNDGTVVEPVCQACLN